MAHRRNALTPAESLVTDTMGRLAEVWGLKRNLGKCWALLYLQGHPLTATEVQAMLGMSTGAVSMTLKELQRWGVIRRVHRPEERRKHYVAEVDVWRVVARVLRARELGELDGAVDNLERAVIELRTRLVDVEGESRNALERQLNRVEGLLDLLRIIASMFRVLVTTARLDATTLATFRLSSEELGSEGPARK